MSRVQAMFALLVTVLVVWATVESLSSVKIAAAMAYTASNLSQFKQVLQWLVIVALSVVVVATLRKAM